MHGRRVLGVTSEQASDRFAIDSEFPEDSGRILAEPRCVLRRKGLGGFAHSTERTGGRAIRIGPPSGCSVSMIDPR